MTATVFVDTNVLIYARDAGEAVKQPLALEWLTRLWTERSGRTSVQVLSEYYVNVTLKLDPGLPPDDAWADVQALLVWRPQTIDAALLECGRAVERRHRLGWWDSLVVAAAQAQGCSVLLTEDLQDGVDFDGVVARNPFAAGVGEAIARYDARPTATARHRPRGRPRGTTKSRAA